jgi:hypothetical protein
MEDKKKPEEQAKKTTGYGRCGYGQVPKKPKPEKPHGLFKQKKIFSDK